MPTQTTANASTSGREAQPSNENNSASQMPTYTTTNEDSEKHDDEGSEKGNNEESDKSDMEESDEEIDKSNKEDDKSDIPIHTILCS